MKIFADFHHAGLYASMKYLFEDRLGHELYRPIGEEWFKEGYWKIAEPYNNNPATIKQYLSLDNARPKDGTPKLNTIKGEPRDGIYRVWDSVHDYHQKAIQLETFMSMNIDVVIASIPAHIAAYKRLIREYNPNAKLIYQIGNIGWMDTVPWEEVDNIMASVAPFEIPKEKNVVFYRQEFDLNVFSRRPLPHTNKIISFVNLLPQPEKWESLKRELPEYEYAAHGISAPDGIKTTIQEVANTMASARFGYHNKPYGDGYGHIIHNWFAIGRPVIVNLSDYKDKLAGELLIENETCINLDRGIPYVVDIINNMTELEYTDMYASTKLAFRKVDFGKDAKNVRAFLNDLR